MEKKKVTFGTLKVDAPIFKSEPIAKNDTQWQQLKQILLADSDLYWEIRKDNQINVYFEGGSIIRLHYCSKHKRMQAFIHEKYIGNKGDKYIDLLAYLESHNISLEDIKANIKANYSQKNGNSKEKWSEKYIQSQYLLKYRQNYIDSEFAYKTDEFDIRIDLVECVNGEIRFVELKRIDDARMLKETDATPKVVTQVKDYKKFISQYKTEILAYYQKVWDIKQNKLKLPNTPQRPTSINLEPQLLIFNRWTKPHAKRDIHTQRMEEILKREGIDYKIETEI